MNNKKRRQAKRKIQKLDRTLSELVQKERYPQLAAELSGFITSKIWAVIKGMLAEEAFVHENAMRTFLKKSNLGNEASYECGVTESLEYVANKMIPQFIESLQTGKAPGIVEDVIPDFEENPVP